MIGARVIRTIEGNTSGGRVAERTRAYSTLCGGIRPHYDAAPAAKSSTPAEGRNETVCVFSLVKRGAEGDGGCGPVTWGTLQLTEGVVEAVTRR